MKKIYTLITFITLFMSCHDMANDAPFIDTTPACPLTADEIKSLEVTHVMPYEEALKEVTDFMDQSSTRSSSRTISEVRVIENTTRTRAADSGEIQLADTTLYIFNFANDQGFAIVSADSRSEGLLAFAESGNFSDTITNPGLAVFLSRIGAYQLEAARKDKVLKDSLYEQAREKMEKLSPDTRTDTWPAPNLGTWIKETERAPTVINQWGQGYPYNMKIPIQNGHPCITGCVPVAVAQAVAYHKYPTTYNDYIYRWEKLSTPDIAELIYQMGLIMRTRWDNNSETDTNRIPDAFKALGYKHTVSKSNYSTDLVINSILGGAPCIVNGYAKMDYYWIYTYKEEYSWLLDGFIKQYRYKVIKADGKILSSTKEERYLVRCNYGQEGKDDGYYLSGVFDTNQGAIDPDPNKDLWIKPDVPYSISKTVGTSGYYRFNVTIFPNIYPWY